MQLKNCNQNILLLFIVFLLYPQSKIFGSKLTFTAVQQKVLEKNPVLHSLKQAVKAAESQHVQAGAWPNPEAEVMLENFGQNEIEIAITQPFELGGKRSARIKIAQNQLETAQVKYEKAKRELTAEVTRRFIAILSLQEQLKQVEYAITVVESSIVVTKHRVESGAAMEIDVIRTEMELSELKIERDKIRREHRQSTKHLSVLWGEDKAVFEGVLGQFSLDFSIPSLTKLEETIAENPEIVLQTKEVEMTKIEIEEARAEGTPDMAISAGYLRNNETGENAALVGFSIDLPLFNRNQGVVAEKSHLNRAARLEKTNAIAVIKAEIFEKHNELTGLIKQLSILENELDPKAEKIYKQIHNFYYIGKSSYLDVLEIRRGLIDLHINIIETKTEAAMVAVDIEEITGINLEPIK